MIIRLIAPGQPASAKNNKRGFVHTSKETGKSYASVALSKAVLAWYEKQVPQLRRQFEALGLPTISQFVHIDTFQFLRDDVMADRSPDGDNAMSACWDALVKAGVIDDDKRCVTWGGSRQQDAARPRVEIEIRVLG